MSDSMKTRIVFDESDNNESHADMAQKQIFDNADLPQFIPLENEVDVEQYEGEIEGILQRVLKPKYSLWQKLVLAGITIFAISSFAQTIRWFMNAWQNQDWIALTSIIAIIFVILAAVGSIISEFRRLYRLRERAEERDTAKQLLISHEQHHGKTFCQTLIHQAGLDNEHPAVMRWQAALHETHSDKEIVTLYAKLVQPVLDQRARREISSYAAESALMIAISPLALVDMAFIAWRNIKLINQIASIYGIELGYFSRIRLFRLVLINVAFAGASELVREIGLDWMSQDLAARLSTRAAQGIGAGLLTARLGIKAMELCRPLPWIDNDRPKLSEFRSEIFSLLKRTLPGKEKVPRR